ncbi:MAG: glycosyltransferase family 2 protein [Acidimicrobiales bacterium]|nr:glycosyltransferase family 2 protein [Acidimicrobiales bacterium]
MRTLRAPPPAAGAPTGPGPIPTFSVVLAAHDVSAFIGGAVASALDQTVPPLEVIVCDDGSTDDLDAALGPFTERIVLVRQANRGSGAARNAAIAVARGDWIAVLDGDDAFHPRRVERLGEAVSARPDLDLVTTDADLVLDGAVVRRCYDPSYRFEVGDQRSAIIRGNFLGVMVAVRRSRLVAVGGFDESMRHNEDWELFARLLLDGSVAGLVDEPLGMYRLHEGSKTADPLHRAQGRVDVLERVASWPVLSDAQRGIALRGLDEARAELAVVSATSALRDGRPDARRLASQLLWRRGLPLRTRAKALAAATAPGWAGRRLALAEAGRRRLTAGIEGAPPSGPAAG